MSEFTPTFADALQSFNPLIAQLEAKHTIERCRRYRQVLAQRTRHITVILEDIYRGHNASAVLRNCDGFGIQDVYTIENRNDFTPDPRITRGAERWLTLHRYRLPDVASIPWEPHKPLSSDGLRNLHTCTMDLRRRGYVIAAAVPSAQGQTLDDLALDQPLAILIGSERTGLSSHAIEQADLCFSIPMYGFSQSFNLSVFSAIVLHSLVQRMRQQVRNWQLPLDQQRQLYSQWLSLP